MRIATGGAVLALTLFHALPVLSQAAPKTPVAVWAHADDEGSVAPILARYGRDGVRRHVVGTSSCANLYRVATIPGA